MRDEVDRSEVRLEAALAELREVGVDREAEDALEDLGENGLGQKLFVRPVALARDVPAVRPHAAELLVASHLGVETLAERLQAKSEEILGVSTHSWHTVGPVLSQTPTGRLGRIVV